MDQEICLISHFVACTLCTSVTLFFVFCLRKYREVQAAMQMSQSWEESLSLVENDSSLQFVQPPLVVLLLCSVFKSLNLFNVLSIPKACFGPGPLLASRWFVERTSTNMLD